MTQTPAAGWFADPEDATQIRYWDGAAWTPHRAPKPASTTEQLTRAGEQLADGVAKGFTAIGSWLDQNTSLGRPGTPTFASVAASCRDEPPRHPLSVTADLVVDAAAAIAPPGDSLGRLVPNPWDPATPNGVAVLVGTMRVGRLPAELEATYCGPLAQLASGGVLATCAVVASAERVTVRLPEVSALAGSAPPA